MERLVYLLCALTSVSCAFLLLRNFRRSQSKLLLWSGLCFCSFAASNIVLFIDLGMLPKEIDLSYYRDGLTLTGLLFLSYGLIWEDR